MKLAVVINQPFFLYSDTYSTNRAFIKFIESFSLHFDRIVIFAPVQEQTNGQDVYKINSKKLDICPLPYYQNVKDLLKRSFYIIPKTLKVISTEIPKYELFWFVLPHPLSLVFFSLCKAQSKPIFTHIRGNINKDIMSRYNGFSRLFAKLYAKSMNFSDFLTCRSALTFAVGDELYNVYKKKSKAIYKISPSLITTNDILDGIPSDKMRNNANKIILLFVGRVEPEKGLEYLIESVRILNDIHHERYHLIIVGKSHIGSEDKESKIKWLVKKKQISNCITFTGYVPHGEKLYELYENSDVFILPSLSEGIPKVLYEAMAKGLPIISTDVGGIPEIIQHNYNGLLIQPTSSDDIVQAVRLLEQNHELRERIIRNGLKTAKEHTIEKARDRMVSLISKHFPHLRLSKLERGV